MAALPLYYRSMNRDKITIKFKKLHPDAVIPKFQTDGASGFDLHAVIDETIPITEEPNNECISSLRIGRGASISPNKPSLISTGLSVAIPKGYEMQIRSRSGLAAKQGMWVLNSPGTIDSDYRGEIKVILMTVDSSKLIKHGDRIAQGVIVPVPEVEIVEVNDLDETARGDGGFGHTGV